MMVLLNPMMRFVANTVLLCLIPAFFDVVVLGYQFKLKKYEKLILIALGSNALLALWIGYFDPMGRMNYILPEYINPLWNHDIFIFNILGLIKTPIYWWLLFKKQYEHSLGKVFVGVGISLVAAHLLQYMLYVPLLNFVVRNSA